MTIAEYKSSLTSKLENLIQNFVPLREAMSDYVADSSVRIWDQHENSAGDDLLSYSPYSKTPIYVSKVLFPSVGTNIGKKGKIVKNQSKSTTNVGARNIEIKSAYLPGGYAELKKALSNRPPLELFGVLKADWANAQIEVKGSKATVALKNEVNIGKTEGLIKKYGRFFSPKRSELDKIKETIRIGTIKALNA